jgi:hypothetical protein
MRTTAARLTPAAHVHRLLLGDVEVAATIANLLLTHRT